MLQLRKLLMCAAIAVSFSIPTMSLARGSSGFSGGSHASVSSHSFSSPVRSSGFSTSSRSLSAPAARPTSTFGTSLAANRTKSNAVAAFNSSKATPVAAGSGHVAGGSVAVAPRQTTIINNHTTVVQSHHSYWGDHFTWFWLGRATAQPQVVYVNGVQQPPAVVADNSPNWFGWILTILVVVLLVGLVFKWLTRDDVTIYTKHRL